ncbi:MAG TPA: SIS domain-containing protein [Candidatus Saccharimonadales bacterium]|nr:SIS domain-containing protein [Candidatus Saccharimonadales bacterium]
MILDDPESLQKIDRSNMLSQMDNTPVRLRFPNDAEETCRWAYQKPENVILAGVGGSGIVGEIITDSLRESTDIPMAVCRTTKVPNYVGPKTLFVAISYSGETRETLGLMEEASRRRAMIATISSGGTLLANAVTRGVPYLKVPPDLAPRVALPELIGAAVCLLERASLVTNASELLLESSASIRNLIESVNVASPLGDNQAKQIALKIQDHLPILMGSEDAVSVLRRIKNELNENSKMPAFFCTFPEGYHDDVEGLRTLKELAPVQPLFVQVNDEGQVALHAREKLNSILSEIGFPDALTIEGIGKHRLARLLTAITLGDYASVYLAVLRGVDPTEILIIPGFRKLMYQESRDPR